MYLFIYIYLSLSRSLSLPLNLKISCHARRTDLACILWVVRVYNHISVYTYNMCIYICVCVYACVHLELRAGPLKRDAPTQKRLNYARNHYCKRWGLYSIGLWDVFLVPDMVWAFRLGPSDFRAWRRAAIRAVLTLYTNANLMCEVSGERLSKYRTWGCR